MDEADMNFREWFLAPVLKQGREILAQGEQLLAIDAEIIRRLERIEKLVTPAPTPGPAVSLNITWGPIED